MAIAPSLRDRAHRAFRETLRRHVEAAVEARAEVLPRDRRGQLDELFVGQVFAQARDPSASLAWAGVCDAPPRNRARPSQAR
jgi:hypothetical protein